MLFCYKSTGGETQFTNRLDTSPRSRNVFAFHLPETLLAWARQDKLLAWLNLVCVHIATSLSIEPDDFEYAPFSPRGGLGRAHQLFGDNLPALLDELNLALVV